MSTHVRFSISLLLNLIGNRYKDWYSVGIFSSVNSCGRSGVHLIMEADPCHYNIFATHGGDGLYQSKNR